MVIEELIAKLGFKTEGLGELKKFENGLKNADSGLKRFGKTLHDKFAGGASAIFPKIASALKSGVAGAASFAWTIGKVALGMAAMTAAVGLTVLAVLKLGMAFVHARGEAARLRREMQLNARGDKTTIGNIEKLQKGFDAIGGKALEGKAKDYVSGVAGKVNDAILDKDNSKFKKAGVSVLDERGNQRDSTAVSIDILAKFANMWKQAQDSRREARTFGLTGDKKKEAGALRRANKSEIDARQFAKDWGIEGPLMAAMQDLKNGAAEFFQRMEAFNQANPGQTQEMEDKAKALAESFDRLKNSVDGLYNALLRPVASFFDDVTKGVIDKMQGAVDNLTGGAKNAGLIPTTKGEVEDGARRKAAIEAESPDIKKAQALAAKVGDGGLLAFLFGVGSDSDKALGRLQQAKRNYNIAKTTAAANAEIDVPESVRKFDAQQLAGSIAEFIAAFKAVEKSISPGANGAKVMNDAAKNIKIDPIKVGGEATVTVPPIKVDASPELKATIARAEAVAKMKIDGSSGATVVKGSNVNTGAPTAP